MLLLRQAAGQFLHLALGMRADFGPRVVEGGDDQVFQDFDLFRIDPASWYGALL